MMMQMTKTIGAGGLQKFISSRTALFLFVLISAFAVLVGQQAFAQAAAAKPPDISLLHEAGQALGILFTWHRMLFLFCGVLLGLILGVIPGLGGWIAAQTFATWKKR